mgnify:CR=1 FL=1
MKRYINIYSLLSFLCCGALLFLSWGLSSRVFEYLIFNTRTELGGSQAAFEISFGFSNCMIEGFAIMQLALPLLAVFCAGSFFRLCTGYYNNAKPRIKRYHRFVGKDILKISMTASLALFGGFLTFYLFGLLTHPIVVDPNYSRSFLGDVFGNNFSWQNPALYFLLEGIYKYLLFPFVYCAFACTVYWFFRKYYLSLLLPLGYYVVLTILVTTIRPAFYESGLSSIFDLFSPSRMLMMGTEGENVPFYAPLISLIPPVIASAIFFWRGSVYEKK